MESSSQKSPAGAHVPFLQLFDKMYRSREKYLAGFELGLQGNTVVAEIGKQDKHKGTKGEKTALKIQPACMICYW